MQLTPPELDQISRILQTYEPAQEAIATLTHYNGDLEASLEALLTAQAGAPTYGNLSLKTVTLQVLRENLCGDDSFRTKLQEYTKNKDSAPLLTGLIVYLATQITLPFPIDPGLATLAVLYIAKVGLEIFCRYTESEQKTS